MLLQELLVDRGLNLQLDSELAEKNRDIIKKSLSKVNRKFASEAELELEQNELKKHHKWNQTYLNDLNNKIKMSELYGPENSALQAGGLYLINSLTI